MTALVHRERTGEGQYIDMSQNESAMQFLTPAFLDYSANGRVASRLGNRRPGYAPHGVYRCAGEAESWCTISVRTDAEWQALCEVMDQPAWAQDTRFATRQSREAHVDALDAHLASWTGQHSAQEIGRTAQAARAHKGFEAAGLLVERSRQASDDLSGPGIADKLAQLQCRDGLGMMGTNRHGLLQYYEMV